MSKYVCYVGRVVMRDLRTTAGTIPLVDERHGIVGMAPIFLKKSDAAKHTSAEPIEMVIKPANLKKLMKGIVGKSSDIAKAELEKLKGAPDVKQEG